MLSIDSQSKKASTLMLVTLSGIITLLSFPLYFTNVPFLIVKPFKFTFFCESDEIILLTGQPHSGHAVANSLTLCPHSGQVNNAIIVSPLYLFISYQFLE